MDATDEFTKQQKKTIEFAIVFFLWTSPLDMVCGEMLLMVRSGIKFFQRVCVNAIV